MNKEFVWIWSVLLDFPYVYDIDWIAPIVIDLMMTGTICNGNIDWKRRFDSWFVKCGKRYRAVDIAKKAVK